MWKYNRTDLVLKKRQGKNTLPFKPLNAFCASASESYETKPNPLGLPLLASLTILAIQVIPVGALKK